ncbi:MAG: PTS sugar transporter subunit IIA [Verrucomicrobiales bacterium]|jgi:nitrogen PTS system EIIA component|nr:PTS sugar transporter subunit IIA [Verrucomicrobiales bacterium]MDP4793499.1 PTS sugar transporter subunit IIA [Verrucomicrobiales bacterium]MDP4849238.1 PTS sugar transporter subunit IIA [Verrucomicrobiales bacterium]MDP4938151.1 PTS sugar transporter subunit IIA [Verrucomicrobiales bacterium]MDP5006548.1 PTS sugar transporter subunit IIA [Verrucomicrobiales bacterium]
MTLADLLTPGCVIAEMQSDEQFPAIAELVDRLVSSGSLPDAKQAEALAALTAREEQRSTGIGGGIAIPHCFLTDLESVVAIFGRSTGGIDFCALDRAPVHFVVLFIVPESQHTLHLKTLAAIAKILNSAETRSRLAEATDESALFEILSLKAATV